MRLRAVIACALLWASVPASADSSLQRVQQQGLTVAVSMNAPWVVRGPDGALTGYDVELVNAMARDLGVRVRFVEAPFSELVGRVAGGQADLAAGGIAITPERARSVVFSEPVGVSVFRTVVAKDRRAALKPRLDGARVAVLAGSADAAAASIAYPKAALVPFQNANAALSAVLGGQADAMVAKSPAPRLAVATFPDRVTLAGGVLGRAAEGLATRPDDARLRDYINNWLEARKADGLLNDMRRHWFVTFDWVQTLQPRGVAPAGKQP